LYSYLKDNPYLFILSTKKDMGVSYPTRVMPSIFLTRLKQGLNTNKNVGNKHFISRVFVLALGNILFKMIRILEKGGDNLWQNNK